MKIIKLVILTIFISKSGTIYSQTGVAINNNGNQPHPAAMLDVSSTNKGILIPFMTTVQRMAIDSLTTPDAPYNAMGLMVYDTDTNGFWYWDGTQWVQAIGPQGPTGNTGIQGIQGLTGNTGIQGIQGPTGNTGIQGIQGLTGNTGIQGIQGPTGNTGIQGIQGPTGNTGIQGIQGPTGNTGLQGIQGTTGNTGVTGVPGSQNAWGLTGNTGTTVGTNFLGTTDNKSFCIKTNNAERIRIDNNGNVGIGMTAPNTDLFIGNTGALTTLRLQSDGHDNAYAGGIIYMSASANLGDLYSGAWPEGTITYVNDGSGTNYMSFDIYRGTPGIYMRGTNPNPTVLVGIGLNTPTNVLHINGQGRATDQHWTTVSDRRLKKNISDVSADECIKKIMQLHPVKYEYIDEYKKYNFGLDGIRIGFISQEIKEIFPQMVSVVEERYGNNTVKDLNLINTSELEPIMVKAFQELNLQVEELKKAVESLKAENTVLKTKIETISNK